jgi:hypothetical protein
MLLDFPSNTSKKRLREMLDILTRINEGLDEIAEQIRLAEELLVTALTFNIMEMFLANHQERLHELEALQKKWVRRQSTTFQQLYDDFKKVAHLATATLQHFPTGDVYILLSCFLQPFLLPSGQVKVGNSEERCQKLADAVRNMNNSEQLCEWLQREVAKDGRQMERITRKLRIRAEQTERGRFLSKLIRLRDAMLSPDGGATFAAFFPDEMNGYWYITSPYLFSKTYPEELAEIIYVEAFRQQLRHGIGIRCPFLLSEDEGGCICARNLNNKKFILRLAHWAMEGKLGDGEWTDLPYPCNRRSC